MSQEINQRILDALNEGYNPQDILSAFSMSKDPEHQSWYENYTQSMRDRARETNMLEQRTIPGKPGLGITERIKQHVEETPGAQLIGEAALTGGGLYVGKRLLQKAFPTPGEQGLAEQNKIARERLELAKNPVLSPLEEARLETEKAKAELQRKRIEILDRQLAKAEAGKQLSPVDQSLLNLYDQQRAAKQATAQAEINKQMGFAPPGAPTVQPPVAGGQPPAPPSPAGAVPPQNRIPSMMAAQEMSNPLGGLASAYTEPLRPPPTVAEMGQQSGGVISEAAKAPAAAIPPATEESKTGRPKGSKTKTPEQRLAEKGGLPGMTKEEAGMRGHLLGMYGGKENPYAQKAYEQVKEILGYTPAYPPDGKGGSLNPEEKGKILDWRKANIEGPKVNLTHEMKKTLKGGGAAAIAALALTPAFVNASESQKRQMLGEALLPMGLTPSELESGTLTEKQLRAYQEAQKLGSPYRSVPPPR